MTLRTDLFDYVVADAGVSALIDTRFHWLQLPESVTYPAARWFVVSRGGHTGHDGPAGLQTVNVQVDVIGESDGDAESVGEAMKAALDGVKSGSLSSIMINETDTFEDADNLWRITQEYLVHHAG